MSRLYVRVLTNFYTHRKTIRLLSKIGDAAFWVPVRIWAYCAENQPDGNLSDYSAEELSLLIGYNKDATSMLQALKDCGYLDSDGMVHDWHEHNGYHQTFSVRAKTAAAARWSKERVPLSPPKGKEKEILKEDKEIESGDKHCFKDATSITVETNARILLHLLNESTGRNFRELDSSLTPIIERLSEPDVTLDGCKVMVSRMVGMWKGTEMEEYLRPSTLFNKTKFNGYWAAKDLPPVKRNGQHVKPNHGEGF